MSETKIRKTVLVDGGIGRVICSIPAIEEYAKTNEVVVVTSYPEAYLNKTNVKVYNINHQHLWEDIIRHTELLHPEPYWDYEYYTQQTHLIQSFYKTLGLKIPKILPRPHIKLQQQEIDWAKDLVNKYKKEKGKTKFIVFQPFGAAARYHGTGVMQGQPLPEDTKVVDETNRSLPLSTAKIIEKNLQQDHTVLVMSHLTPVMLNQPNGQQQPLSLRQWMAIISQADYVIGIDSCAQHLAYAFNIPGFFVYGGTYQENLAYKEHVTWAKKGFPHEYNPIRLPSNPMMAIPTYNEGAIDLCGQEEQHLNTLIKDWLLKQVSKEDKNDENRTILEK